MQAKFRYDPAVTHLPTVGYEQSTGKLRAVYERMRERPLPPVYRPGHGGVPGIIRAHSLDPELMTRVFGFSANVNGNGPLAWSERETINTVVSRLNQCFY